LIDRKLRVPGLALASFLVSLLAACSTTPAQPAPLAAMTVEVPTVRHPAGETPAWWLSQRAARAAGNGAMNGRATNVILFLGDGMSLTTVAAARILEGQRKGNPGEENQLSWETSPAPHSARPTTPIRRRLIRRAP
jgi:alkaline phosphatase